MHIQLCASEQCPLSFSVCNPTTYVLQISLSVHSHSPCFSTSCQISQQLPPRLPWRCMVLVTGFFITEVTSFVGRSSGTCSKFMYKALLNNTHLLYSDLPLCHSYSETWSNFHFIMLHFTICGISDVPNY